MGPDVAFGHDAGDCSVCCCGDNLADWLGTDVPCDVDTGDVGLAVFVCDNVAIVIEVDFSAAHVGHGLIADEDENAVDRELGFFACIDVFEHNTAYPMTQAVDLA